MPLTPAERIMKGATFQPKAWMSSKSGWYVLIFCSDFVYRVAVISVDKF